MNKYKTNYVIGFVLLFTTMMLSMIGCAQNKPSIQTPDGSNPNEYSAYLFSAGNVLYYNGDFANAEGVFRLALLYDSHSSEIKKALFNTILRRTENNEIPLNRFHSFVDSLLVQKSMDKTMLEQAYSIYSKSDDKLNAKGILNIYLKKYASARAYTSLFYLEQELYGISRHELLEKAYKLAGNDAPFLNSLGYLYLAFDSTKAEKIWLNSRKYDTTAQSAQFLWQLYTRQNNTKKLHKLWDSFQLPVEKDKLLEVVNNSFEKAEFNSFVMLSDAILASNDPQFILTLLQASWYTNEDALFEQSWSKLQTMQLSKLESQLSYFYATLFYLRNDNYADALNWLSELNGKNALDELVMIYRATSLMNTTDADTLRIEIIKGKLGKTVEPATEEQLALPVKNYLLAAIDSLGIDNIISVSDSIALDCAEWFYYSNRSTYDTYFWLALYFNKTKQDARSKAMLREALDEYPEDAALLNWLGYSYVLTGDNLDEAEILIRRALQLAPDSPYYLDSLAWLYFIKGDFQQAVALMELPSRLEKMPSEIAFHLGSIYNAVNEKEAAIQYLKLAIEINDDPDTVAKAQALLDSMQ